MNSLYYLKPSNLLIIELILLFLTIFACRGADYTGQYFSFPPGSKPHENNWQYTALVIVKSNHSPISDKSRKTVTFKIYDKNINIYLKEDFVFDCASVRASLEWEKFEEVKIYLDEVGNEFAKDAHNKLLRKIGPIRLAIFTYEFDKDSRLFRRKIGT